MSLYRKYILPWGVNKACGGKPVARQRAKIVPLATGKVLEIGIGSGLNLPFYDRENVDLIWGLEPDPNIRVLAEGMASEIDLPVEFIDLPGEEIPLADDSADTVVVTYTLCTIEDTASALRQIRRVLKPGASMLFCEHGRAPDENIYRWQNRIDPIWARFTGGCHLNRAIDDMIENAGFAIEGLETMYIPGPRTHSFNYWGRAVAKD
jgi:ubiquinone/menaquinone biosynthesis C-methylase UbiE